MEKQIRIDETKSMFSSEMLDLKVLQRLAGRYSQIAGFYAYGLDRSGTKIADIKGNSDEIKRLISLVGESRLDSLFHRISDDDLEVQAIEDTDIPNIKIAGSSLHVDGVALVNWIVIAVISDEEYINQPGAVNVSEFTYSISYDKLLSAVDVIRDITSMIVTSKLSVANAEAESLRSKFSEEETKASLKRVEATSEIVALLDNDNAIEAVMNTMIEILGKYLGISSAMIVQTRNNIETMDVVAEWTNNGVVSLFDKARRIEKFVFAKTDKPQIISFDSDVSSQWHEQMEAYGITAVVVLPIKINNGIGMYSCFFDSAKDRRWAVDEVKFLYDAVKILENIITKRIQKNSLASSYASLEAVLDNIGSAIYVRDLENGTPLFSNKILKSTFASEIQDGSIDELFDTAIPINKNGGIFEINHIAKNRWYDLHYTYINWVDGRKASLCAVYDVTDKKNYQRRIEQQAYTDFLTGLYNRMCCERDLAMHIDSAKSNNTRGALLYLDLDDFKHINDGLGHQYGDVLLKAISHSLRRIEGIQNTCYRMGGDEFVIIIPPTSYEDFERIVKGIKDIFSKPWYLKDADYYCTMSMGIVEFPESGESVQELIKKADIAMYEAKKSGKNRVAQYSDKIVSSSNKRLDMEKNMRDATSTGYKEFEVYYQPIIDVLSPNTPCIGAEALIRWNSVELGFISPSDFIPLAEYLGLINPIGNYVLKEACKSVKYWNENGHPDYKVNVNLSVVQLLQTDIVDIVKNTIEEVGINPANLTLEVTESLAINDMERMKKILNSIKTLGVKIALDDFGTGYSSLNHIREIPFDIIKVDQSFVRDLADDAYSQSFIKMVAELAETIGVNVCVEGIETASQFDVLEGMKVKMVQGYYFDRPMTKTNFETKYVLNN
ncbi:MAG: EAL domain-containing protein [Lachnospiraceae bacterium]|nr:EAL domain-containing protein [Lachnospiraceae bacterium]